MNNSRYRHPEYERLHRKLEAEALADFGQEELAESGTCDEAEHHSDNDGQFENFKISIPVILEKQSLEDHCHKFQDPYKSDGWDETLSFSEVESGFHEDPFYAESTFSGSIGTESSEQYQVEVPVGSTCSEVVVQNQESDEESLKPSKVDGAIEKACLEMKNFYSTVSSQPWFVGQTLDFSDLVYQRAYVGMYVGTHLTVIAKKLSDFWMNSPKFFSWLQKHSTLNVASVGGGPGTDILGISLFLEKHNLPNFIEGTIYDAFNWESQFKRLVKVMNNQHISQYIHCDPFNFYCPMSKSMQRKLNAANLVTFVKFFSALPRNQSVSVSVLQDLITTMKPGAMLFVVECAGGGIFQFVCEIVEACGMRLIEARMHENIQTWPSVIERLGLSRKCCANCNPQRYTKVSAVLYQKVSW